MADITISYKGATIAEVSASGTTTLETAGKYCEDDITIEYVRPNVQTITDDSIYLHRLNPYNSNAKNVSKLIGCTYAWNQLANNGSASVTSGHKYISCNSGTWSIGTSNGTAISADMVFDITLMFGSTIADYIYGLGSASCVAWFRNLFPSASYPYDAGSLLSVKTSASKMKNADESASSSYALSNIELRGIPKLDANNKLYYDGDEYAPSGTVTRKYGIVDLGTLSWKKSSVDNKRFSSSSLTSVIAIPQKDTTIPNIVCSNYTTMSFYDVYSRSLDKGIAITNASSGARGNVNITDSAYSDSDAATFKSAMSGVYLIYELATPTTESATAYTQAQKCYPNGTEEFVDGRTVEIPVNAVADYEVTS